jgi:hypothetical protein
MKKLFFILALFAVTATASAQCIFVKDTLVTDSTKYKITMCPENIAQYTAGINRYVVHMDLWMKVEGVWIDIPYGSYAAIIDETDPTRNEQNRAAMFPNATMTIIKNNLLKCLTPAAAEKK